MTMLFWGVLLRLVHVVGQAAPTIIIGLIVAAVMRRFLGMENTRRMFGGNTWRSIPVAWFWGMMLPVCSLGTIPILREMRRVGMSPGSILAFALSAPLFNPLSLLYGLTLSEPWTLLAFACCSLLLVSVVGLLFDWVFPANVVPEAPLNKVEDGPKRLLAIFMDVVQEASGAMLGYLAIALLGVAALIACLPHGALQTSMNYNNTAAPLTMTIVAIPAYATPMLVISQVGSMFQHGNSVGAAFVLLALGTGVNLGLIWWTIRNYGWGKAACWFAATISMVLLIAYTINDPLHPRDVEPAGHTHAFDVYTQPVMPGTGNGSEQFLRRSLSELQAYELLALFILVGLITIGFGLKVRHVDQRLRAWTESCDAPQQMQRAWYNRALPGSVLGAAAILMIIVISIVGAYAYYPPPETVFKELASVRTEAISMAVQTKPQPLVVEHWIGVWDDWTRRLEVGVYLRTGKVTDYQQIKSRILRNKLEDLKHAVQENDKEEIRAAATAADLAYTRMKKAYGYE
jgi:uncharacterized membrane protein YraQ (UPF0718 family)